MQKRGLGMTDVEPPCMLPTRVVQRALPAAVAVSCTCCLYTLLTVGVVRGGAVCCLRAGFVRW